MTQRRPRLTLTEWFVLTMIVLAAVVAALFYWFFESSRRSILARSDELRDETARRIDDALSSDLRTGATAIA